ncbi:MAG: DUF748 domain-containing protein [Thermoplasmatales archaeon]|nr:DUF748 domain-containing protein [Thermoplasmatales archaeon]
MKSPIKKFIASLLICFILYTLLGFLVAPLVLKTILVDKLSQSLQQVVSIEKLRMNPYVLSVSIENFTLKENEETEPFASFGKCYVNLQSKSLFKKSFIFKELLIEEPFIHIKRNQEGAVNFLSLIAAIEKKEDKQSTEVSEKKSKAAIPIIQLDSIDVSKGRIIFSDASLSSAEHPVSIKIQNMTLTGKNISTSPNSRGSIMLTLEDELGGTVSAEGPLSIIPVFADLQVAVTNYHILPFKAHILDTVRVIVEDGKIATKGNIGINESTKGKLTATYKGTAAVSDFSSIDEATKDQLLKFKDLRFIDIDTGYNPGFLKIDKINISDFYAGLIINPDKTINVLNILKKEETIEISALDEKEGITEKESQQLFDPIIIKEVSFENGHVNFTDKLIKPVYSTNLFNIEGKISGLSSKETRRASVEFRGKLDKTVPIEITGEIDPFSEDLYADMQIILDNKDLSPLTPYSGKYLGYVIDKGKLVLKLNYKIDKKKLISQNKIFINQLTLGDKVDSPDAIKLPVKLGIALLQNRKGEIDLDIPVTGEIDAPEFSVGYFVIKIIKNIIEKAVTAPFALLGSIFGGGEELGYVEFGYGDSTITEKNAKKLDMLITALYDRPLLKLDIEGHVDINKDTEILRQSILEKKVKFAKYDYYIKKGLKTLSVEEINIEPDNYRKYLIMAYIAEIALKQKKEKRKIEKQKTDEVEQLMLNKIIVTEGDLRGLAYERASRVKDYILRSGKVEKERVFLIEPKSLQTEIIENVKNSKVKFYLK